MPLPQYLYKYRSLSSIEHLQRSKNILVNNRIYFAPASSFNDPFEGQVPISFNGSATKKLNKLRSIAIKRGPNGVDGNRWAIRALESDIATPEAHIHEDLRKVFREEASFCTLSEKHDDKLMWAHYADGHKGICIEFKPRTSAQIKWFEHATPIN